MKYAKTSFGAREQDFCDQNGFTLKERFADALEIGTRYQRWHFNVIFGSANSATCKVATENVPGKT